MSLLDGVDMNVIRLVSVIGLLLLAACGSAPQPPEDGAVPPEATAVAVPVDGMASYATENLLLLEASGAERAVLPGSDEVFDFKLTNTSGDPLPVVVILEHAGGQRWRTSLCVEKQCLLGDGSEPSVTDPVILPPYLEQPFQAHLFVDQAARPGEQAELTLRVEPAPNSVSVKSLMLRAEVATP